MPPRTSSRAGTPGRAAAPERRPGTSRPSCGRAQARPCRGGRRRISRRGVLGLDLAQARAHATLPRDQLVLEPLELLLAPTHELELRADQVGGLVEQPAAAVHVLGRRLLELAPDLGARGL